MYDKVHWDFWNTSKHELRDFQTLQAVGVVRSRWPDVVRSRMPDTVMSLKCSEIGRFPASTRLSTRKSYETAWSISKKTVQHRDTCLRNATNNLFNTIGNRRITTQKRNPHFGEGGFSHRTGGGSLFCLLFKRDAFVTVFVVCWLCDSLREKWICHIRHSHQHLESANSLCWENDTSNLGCFDFFALSRLPKTLQTTRWCSLGTRCSIGMRSADDWNFGWWQGHWQPSDSEKSPRY